MKNIKDILLENNNEDTARYFEVVKSKLPELQTLFINKLEISLKECSETEYWLELIFRKGKMSEVAYNDLRNKCGSIRRRLIASITTAKENT